MAAEASGQPPTLLTSREELRDGGEEPAACANDGSSAGVPLVDQLRKLQKRFQQEEGYITLLKAENDLLQTELQHLIGQVAKRQSRKSRRSCTTRSPGGLPRNGSTETSQSGLSGGPTTVEGTAGMQSLQQTKEETEEARADSKPGADTSKLDAPVSSPNATDGDAHEEDGAMVAPLSSVANQAGSEDGSILMVEPMKSMGAHIRSWGPMRRRAHRLVTGEWFDVILGVVIFLNAIVIGWESEYYARRRARGESEIEGFSVFDIFEVLFLIIYITELGLRYAGSHWPQILKSKWTLFDTLLVVVGIVQFVLFGLKLHHFVLSKIMLGRILRLARLTRLMRLTKDFRELWVLVNGLMHSFPMLFYTFITMGTITYVFAIIGLETIQHSDDGGEEYNKTAVDQFGSLGKAMMTLIQAVTLDSIGAIYFPIILHNGWFAVYFVTFMLIASIALMNLVTAIMVESSIEQANSDRETRKALANQKRAELVGELREMFKAMDSDGSGRLDIHELRHAPPHVMEKLQEIVQMEDAIELFQTLDTDGSGSLGITEFLEGALKASQGKPMELLCVMKQCHDIQGNLKELSTAVRSVKDGLPMELTAAV